MKTIVFSFGRTNPPTKGHEKLIKKVLSAAKALNADHKIYLSQSQNSKTDPLAWSIKLRACQSAFPDVNISHDTTLKTPFQVLENLSKDYEKAVLVVGSDQLGEFKTRMLPYAKQWGIELEIISAGARNKSETINGISASKMRQYAKENKKKLFCDWLPSLLPPQMKISVWKNTILGLNDK